MEEYFDVIKDSKTFGNKPEKSKGFPISQTIKNDWRLLMTGSIDSPLLLLDDVYTLLGHVGNILFN